MKCEYILFVYLNLHVYVLNSLLYIEELDHRQIKLLVIIFVAFGSPSCGNNWDSYINFNLIYLGSCVSCRHCFQIQSHFMYLPFHRQNELQIRIPIFFFLSFLLNLCALNYMDGSIIITLTIIHGLHNQDAVCERGYKDEDRQ
ncbi:uncharacterized protein DS421_10g308510 [Arachis hypogaea]|nr:uncharacterized protein DS421_10g308510 [Arachis hypogaea]